MQSLQAIQTADLVMELEVPPHRASPQARNFRERTDPFQMFSDEEFRKRYRFSKATASTIVDLVKGDLEQDRRGRGTPPHLQVLTAIRCWGRREMQEDAGDHHGLSQPTTSRICARVAHAIARHSHEYIKMPTTLAEQEAIMQKFKGIKHMPTVIGCIDCTHVKIRKTGGDTAQYYINRKGYYSLNVQVTCDADLKIRDIVARWRGCTHDARIFNESALKTRLESGEFIGRLLGDSGYKLEPYLFTPILRPNDHLEEKYNESHCSTRNVVERCFGVWKQRFQCLLFGMTVHLKNVKPTIVALAVLHNIAILNNEAQPDGTDTGPRRYPVAASISADSHIAYGSGSRVRNNAILRAFIVRHFSE